MIVLKLVKIRVETILIMEAILILQKGRFLLILFFKRVLKSSDNLLRNGKTKLFFSAVNVSGFSVSLLKKFYATIHQFHRKCVLF